jgi:S-adenosylmethionine synthetase
MAREYSLSSESVSEGHPDKIADQISDAILDGFLRQDSYARVACETMVTHGLVLVAGEITSSASVPFPDVARQVIKDIGYTDQSFGFDWRSCAINVSVQEQASDIAIGVVNAGLSKPCEIINRAAPEDQVIVFGYATDETPEYMPLGLMLAHRIMQRQAQLRKGGQLNWLRPDAKAQVTVRYCNGTPISIDSIVLSTQHSPDIGHEHLVEAVVEEIIKPLIPAGLPEKPTEYLINAGGRFVIGGPAADTGLTGRKLMVDTYGGACPHGGGAFSGKDPTKMDRSAAYMARYIAKNIVAAGLARRCTLQLSYARGRPQPVSLTIDLHGTGRVADEELEEIVPRVFNLALMGTIQSLDLQRPIYQQTAVYGHFGRDLPDFTWERTDMTAILQHYTCTKGGKNL